MWVALAYFFSGLGRLGAFTFSVISLALVSLTLTQRDWMDGISIYIVVISCLSIIIAPWPPYPNFLVDAFFSAAWLLCGVFAFLITFLKSTCYGMAEGTDESVACPKYQAFIAMCFLAFGAWSACAAMGGLLFIIAIVKNARLRSNHYFRDPTVYREEHHATGALAPAASTMVEERGTASAPNAFDEPEITPVPNPFDDRTHISSTNGYGEKGVPSVTAASDDKSARLGYNEKSAPLGYDEKGARSSYDEKGAPSPYDEKAAPSTKYTGFTSDTKREEKVVPAAAPVVFADDSYAEDQYEPTKEPEYMRVRGLGGDFILRHWLLLGLAGLVLLAVLLPIVIIYAVPAFAYYITDNLEVPKTLYGAITGFEEDHATFDITSDIRAPSGISASIEPMTMQMFNPDTLPDPIPIAFIDTQEIKIKGGQKVQAHNGQIRVGNMTEWTKLWRKFFFQPIMDVGLKATLVMKVGPMKISIDTLKVVEYQGILNASGLQLGYLKLQPPDLDGANTLVALSLVNPAILTLNTTALVTADFRIGNTLLAETFIDDFSLKKGNNSLNARAKVDLETIFGLLQNITDVLGTELPYLAQGYIVSRLQTTTMTTNGVSWPYWNEAFQGINLLAGIKMDSISPQVISSVLGEGIGGFLTGTAGDLITQEPGGVTDVNVTLINKLIRNLTIVDAELL